MLQNLPLEVLEYMCSFITVHDLVNVWNALEMEGNESFWKKMCQRQGYEKVANENSSWKNVFLRHINWISGTYVKRKYIFELNSVIAQTDRSTESLCGQLLLVDSCEEETVALDICGTPTLAHSFSAKFVSQQGNKLLTYNSSELILYSYERNMFNELYSTLVKFPMQTLKFCSLSDDFLAFVDYKTSSIKVIDLKFVNNFSFPFHVTPLNFFSIRISNKVLFILILDGSIFKLKRFHLANKIWMQDLVLFKNAALIAEPKVYINSRLMVSWSSWLEGCEITPVKVFSLDGTFLSTLPFTNHLLSSRFQEPSKILWMILKCDYLIFSTSKNAVLVWTAKDLNCIKEIPKEEDYYIGQKVISSSLLVLCYKSCFKVVDFINTTYLYEVPYNIENSINIFQRSKFFANEYFYIYFQWKEDEAISQPNNDKNHPLALNFFSKCRYETLETRKTRCFMQIYDFK